MKLRDLEIKDIEYQLEWMRDQEIFSNFQHEFENKNYDDVKNFIQNGSNACNIHKAIVNDNDEYLGTISLKNIDYYDKTAEYAIVIRKEYWGHGVGRFATEQILNIAIELKLSKIYLTVLETNVMAQKLYLKFGFERNSSKDKEIFIRGKLVKNLYYEKLIGGRNEF